VTRFPERCDAPPPANRPRRAARDAASPKLTLTLTHDQVKYVFTRSKR
jgi:hypothetical protein